MEAAIPQVMAATPQTMDVVPQAMSELSDFVRDLTRRIQANSDISNAAREDAGIPVHKTSRTPSPTPKTVPTGSVISTERLEHTVSYCDASTPTRKARPAGVTGCEIFVAVANVAPQNPEDYRFVALSTRTPERVTFKPEDGGKTANYLLRWVNTRGETGPWSQVTSATIPAV